MTRGRWRAALVGLAFVAMTRHAWAGPREVAAERFEEGRALMKAGRPYEAIPKFLASLDAEKTSAALLNLADAYERVGKTASAYQRFRELSEAKDIDPARAEEARKRAEALKPRLATIVLKVPAASAGAPLSIDGVAVKPTGSIPLDPGQHSLKVDESKVLVFEIAEAEKDKPIDVPALPVPVASTTEKPPVVVTPAPPPDDTLRSTSYVVGGVGAAGLIAGTVLGVVALSKASSVKDACTAYPHCPPSSRDDVQSKDDSARAFGTASTIAFVAGGVLLAGGVVLYLVAPKDKRDVGLLRGTLTW